MRKFRHVSWLAVGVMVSLTFSGIVEARAASSPSQFSEGLRDLLPSVTCNIFGPCEQASSSEGRGQLDQSHVIGWYPEEFGKWAQAGSPELWGETLLAPTNDFRAQFGGGSFQGAARARSGDGPDYLPLIVPTLSIIERYDSNVFSISPPSASGLKLDDFVTTITPQFSLTPRKNSLVTGSVTVGAIGEIYAYHPDLNYIGANAGGFLDLSRLVQMALPRVRLQLFESFMYTPQPPAFLGGSTINTGNAEPIDEGSLGSSYARGLQVQRTNTVVNSAGATSTYAVSPGLTIFGTATHSFQKYGATPGAQQIVTLVDSETRAVTIGPQYSLTPTDTVRFLFSHSRTDFTKGQTQDFPPYFETNGGILFWSHLFGPTVVGSASYGAQELIPSHSIQHTGTASLTWKKFPDLAQITFSRQVAPGFLGVGGATISDMVGLGVSRTLSSRLSGTMGANYAHTETTASDTISNTSGNSSSFSFNSYTLTGGLTYQLGLTMVGTITYEYSKFDSSGLSPAAGITGGSVSFDKHVVLLRLVKAWF